MAYLFLFIIAALILAILLLPISITLTYKKHIHFKISLPFFDLFFYNANKKRRKRGKPFIHRVKSTVRYIKAGKKSLDYLLRGSKLTVLKDTSTTPYTNSAEYNRKYLIFSVLISYLASKSGRLITEEGINKQIDNDYSSTIIETRFLRILMSLITFLIVRFFPKKEYGIVR